MGPMSRGQYEANYTIIQILFIIYTYPFFIIIGVEDNSLRTSKLSSGAAMFLFVTPQRVQI